MKNKRISALLLSLLLCLGGCSGQQQPAPAPNVSSQPEQAETLQPEGPQIDCTFQREDLSAEYEESGAVQIAFDEDTAHIQGEGASFNEGVLRIAAGGTYVLSGRLEGRIAVDVKDTEKVHLVFNGASVFCGDYAPLIIQQAEKVIVTLARGTENTLEDGKSYTLGKEENDSKLDGAVFSRADLTINGEGSLHIRSNHEHGIVSKDDLILAGGRIEIQAAGGGLYGKDCVKIAQGTFVLHTQGDGIQSGNDKDAGKGFIYIKDGDFQIDSQSDAIQAEQELLIENGTFSLLAAGGAANNQGDASGGKGIKSGGNMLLNSGSFWMDCMDDGLHSGGNLTINGGSWEISAGDDAIHGDAALTVSGGDDPYFNQRGRDGGRQRNGYRRKDRSCGDG